MYLRVLRLVCLEIKQNRKSLIIKEILKRKFTHMRLVI